MSATPDIQLSPAPTPAEEKPNVLDLRFEAARSLGLQSLQDIPDTPGVEIEEPGSLVPFATNFASPALPTPAFLAASKNADPTASALLSASEAIELVDLRQRQSPSQPESVVQMSLEAVPLRNSAGNLDLYMKSPFAVLSWKAKAQFASMCFLYFQSGWNDGSTGPLLPRIQAVYDVRPMKL